MPTPPRYNAPMNVELTPDQREFVRIAIESGRIGSEEEAVQQALELWVRRERRRLEIIAMIDEADASLARGEGRVFRTKEDTQALAEEIKARGRRRLAETGNIELADRTLVLLGQRFDLLLVNSGQ